MAEADAIAVGGRAYRIIEVPVLREPLARGGVIEDGDVEWRPIKLNRLRENVAREAEEIIGKVAKRRLRAGAPLRSRDLGLPIVIAKGSVVTLALEAPGLMLSATGRALENGSDGALIRVMNVHSKQTVEAIVVGPDRVRVPYR
jgi:flagella basal body P-ring formation protein FlgA